MARRKPIELGAAELCPCESGKAYGRCCKKRAFKWERDYRGNILKSIPLTDRVVDVFSKMRVEFKETFGRSPGRGDPLFIQQFYVSEADMRREVLRAMKAAGTPPSLVYAYKRTGRMVTKEGRRMLAPDELQEWDAAIDEYYEAIDSGEDFDVFEDGNGLLEFLKDGIKKNQVILGFFIDKHFNNYRNRKGSEADVESVVAFSTTNFVRTLRSIHILLEQGVAYEAYHLARVLYENYLAVRYVYAVPGASEIFFAQLGLLVGTHELARSRGGSPLQSKILEVATGEKINVPSRRSMAANVGNVDLEVYDHLYRSLSSHVHSEITNIDRFISDRGFDYFEHDPSMDVLATSHLICLLFISCMKNNSPCTKRLKGDLSFAAERSLFALEMVKEMANLDGQEMPEIYAIVIESVIAADPHLAALVEAIRQGAAEGRDGSM